MDSGMYHTTANEVFTLASKLASQPVGGERDRATPIVCPSHRYFFAAAYVFFCGIVARRAVPRARMERMDPARNHWYVAYYMEGLTSSESAGSSQPVGSTAWSPNVSVSLTNHKTKASKTC